ncbi:MAG: polysaccharide deacetylase family protein, partial [Thermoleophilia bacterium]|nr:polysaccharide deacetylase family protein [Thermoleophilia bacterium]
GQPKVPAGPAVYSVNTSKKLIALTFDDGPNGAHTDAILSVLAKHKVHATFFVLGQNSARDGARLRKEAAAGHAIGNHGWDHAQLTNLSSSQVRSQLSRTSDKIEQITGKRPDTFRAPYGARNSSVDAVARSLGLRDILWDVDTVDWRRPGSAAITNEAVSSARTGSIILMHDGGGDRSQTAKSLDGTITRLQAKGYQFVTVPQLMAASGK